MSGNGENRGGCGRDCCSCLNNRKIFSCRLPNFSVLGCFIDFILLTAEHYVRSLAIILSCVLVNLSWFIFEGTLSIAVFVYSIALILCVFITFIQQQGSWNDKVQKAREEKKQKQKSRAAQQPNQPSQGRPGSRQLVEYRQGGVRFNLPRIHHDPESLNQPPAEPLGNIMEQSAPARYKKTTIEIIAEVHEPRESRNDIELPSTSNNEPIQQPTHSDSSSNLLSTNDEQSTKSTSMLLDDVANEEFSDDELLEQAGPSNLERNLP